MARRRIVARVLGYLSVVCSPLSLWLLFWVKFVPKQFDMPFNGWAGVWATGFALSCAAAWLGSRWWLLSTLTIVASFCGTMILVFAYFG
jgi:hypothetical protein